MNALADNPPRWFGRAAAVPAVPPPENPLQEGLDQYESLRANYALVVAQFRETEDAARGLLIENAHHRQQITELRERNKFLEGYATALKTRLTLIKEAVIAVEAEAARYGINAVVVPHVDTNEEAADAAEGVAIIHRANDGITADRLPVNTLKKF
jgi:hypothetical protein